jgi:TolB-like protein/Tfp pilus assembly protein PilF
MGDGSLKLASTPTGAVFLSYASQDAEAAQKICEALRAADIEVWFDQSELRGGDAWDRKIREQIRHCALFIPLISAHSQARLEGYFRREWKFAVERKRDIADELVFLLPVVIDKTPERDASVPEGFHEVQWTRLPGGAASQEFIRHVSRLLTGSAHPPKPAVQALQPGPAPAPTRPPAGSKSGPPLRMWLLLIAVATAAIVGYIGIDQFIFHKGTQRSAASATTENVDKSIAVLPFVDMSENHDQEYLADGMAEEILDLLVKLPGLKVVGRTSSFSFKGKQTDLPTIGKALGVAYIVEGSIRRINNRIRVAAQLVDARDGTHRWSDTYEGSTTDVLRLQDEIALRVARALDLELGAEAFPSRMSIDSPEAYEYYLRGVRELEENSTDSIDAAREYFQKSLALDPRFGPAAVGIATTYQFKCVDAIQPEVMCPRAHEAVESALKLDPRNPDAYAVRAELSIIFDWNWSAAEADVKRAIELGGSQITKFAAARLAYAIGNWVGARELLNGIIATDPFNPNAKTDLAFFVELKTGHFEEAESWILKALQIAPKWSGGNFMLGLTQLMQGKLDEALMSMKREKVDEGQLIGLALVYSAMGRKADSDASLTAMERRRSYFPSDFARVHAFSGDLDRAMNYLERHTKPATPIFGTSRMIRS